MKILILAAALALTGCNDAKQVASTVPAPEIEDVKEASLDIIYAAQEAFTQNGSAVLDANIKKMQTVLQAWPESKKINAESCYMTLRNETARLLNLQDGLGSVVVPEEIDFRFDCRESINYKYDKNRTHDLWKRL